MVKVIELESDFVNKFKEADRKRGGLAALINQMMEHHVSDPDGSFVSAPVFQALLAQHAVANAEFEDAKSTVEPKYIPEEKGFVPLTWDLNYKTCELTIEYQEA